MSQPSSFSNLHHVCIVINDLDEAVEYYESLGIGPWTDFPSLEPFGHELEAPDSEAFFDLRYKFAPIGEGLQLQLCQPGKGRTPQRDFLESNGPGVFHLGFSVSDVDAAEEASTESGLDVLLHGRVPSRAGFTYFDTRKDAGVVLQVRQAAK